MTNRRFISPVAFRGPALVVLFVCSCAVGPKEAESHSSSAVSTSLALPMPVISRNVPAYASSGDPTQANDASCDTQWRSSENTSSATPSWIAYDLSGVSSASRGQVDVAWYNANGLYSDYDLYAKSGDAYNDPRDYTIDVNAAPGGALPASGWQTLVTVTGNTMISREHVIDLRPSSGSAYNWLRIRVTAINGAEYNTNTAFNLDVHDASQGVQDSWLFLGDSITSFSARNDGAGIGAPSFAELVNNSNASFFPAAEGAGEGGWNSGTAFGIASPDGNGTLFDSWLRTFPGKFVCLSYGTNDGTDGSGDATGTYDNFVTMVTKVVAAGKVPVVPHVPWAEDASHQTNAQLINAALDTLYVTYPQVVKGPDLYGVLEGHTEWYQDDLHPNPQGEEQYRQAWANAMLGAVYSGAGTAPAPTSSSTSPTPPPTSSSTAPTPPPTSSPPASSPPASGSDPAEYSFESGVQGWSAAGSTSSVSTSTTTVYAGKQSLQAVFENASSSPQTFSVAVDPGSAITGAANITLHFWYPADSGIAYVGAFAQEQASPWTMYSPANAASSPGTWNSWTIGVPASAIPLQAIALQFVLDGGASATVYLDSVSW
jgi:hypothetical protein